MKTLPLQPPPRVRLSVPFVIGILALGLVAWVAILVRNYPDDGIRALSPSHQILAIDENSNGKTSFEVGDILLEIGGEPIVEDSAWYWGKHPGDTVRFLVQRGDRTVSVEVKLASPPPQELFRRLMPLFVAVVFLAVALAVEAFAPRSPTTRLFFWFFFNSGLLLTTGQASGLAPSIVLDLYYFLWWIVGPISVHFHFNFPQENKVLKRGYLLFLYVIGFLGGVSHLIWGTMELQAHPILEYLIPLSRLFLALNLLICVILLYYNYQKTTSSGARAKIRLVFLGGLLAALPLITTYLLPEVLLNQPLLPTPAIFLFLSALPLVYGYAVFRYRLIEIERHINRGVTVLIVFFILVGIYLGIFSVLTFLLPQRLLFHPALNTLLILVLASTILPISRRVQRLVDTLFYGGWYDYRSAILQITSGLEHINDLTVLAREVSDRLVRTLRIADACIFFSDIHGDFSVVAVAPEGAVMQASPEGVDATVLPRSSLDFLLRVGDEERETIAKALAQAKLSPEEFQLLGSTQGHLWVPIISHQTVKGLLALGPKYGGDVFSAEDMDILRVVSRNLGPVIENIHLLNQVQQYATELEMRVQERTSELFEAKKRVEAILTSVGDGVVVTNLGGTIELINQAMKLQTSYEEGEILKRNYFEWLTLTNPLTTIDAIRASLEKGDIWSGELLFQRKNGEQYDILLTIAPVRDQNGEVVNYVATQRDITYRKELDRLKDIFVADVSHELRTPTTNIGLYLELLETAPEHKKEEYIRVLKEQSQLLRRLVEDILDLSRLAIGKTRKMEFGPVDLNLLIEQAITAYTPAAQQVGLQVSAELASPAVVRGEAHYLSRAIQNLIGNAIQYTPAGWVKLMSWRNGEWICLEVQDSGIGISEEDMPHIFERFYRGRSVRQSKVHGTGLGLAIVKEIIELHNGYIEVESKVGVGSVFRLYIPVWSN